MSEHANVRGLLLYDEVMTKQLTMYEAIIARPFPTEAQPSKPSSHTTARTAPSCQPRYWLSVTGELCGGEIYAALLVRLLLVLG